MKNLNSFLKLLGLAGIGIFFLSACTRYQYVSLNSTLQKGSSNEFINENDSVRIKYTFAGENCPITVEVYNKLSVPLYVDWKRSAVVINGRRLSYWIDETTLNANLQGTEIRWTKYISSAHGQMQGSLYRNEQVSFIPPQSFVTVTPLFLKHNFFNLSAHKDIKVKVLATTQHAERSVYFFEQDTAPLSFRSFLTLSITNDFSAPTFKDDIFWVEEVTETMDGPAFRQNQKANQFYLTKSTGAGSAIMGVGGFALLIGFAAVAGSE